MNDRPAKPKRPLRRSALRNDAILLVAHSEQDRAQFARLLHDDLAQKLTVAGLELAVWKDELAAGASAPSSDQKIAALSDLLNSAMASARSLSSALWPRTLDTFGVSAAVEGMLSRLRTSSGITVRFTASPEPITMSAESAIHLVRILDDFLAACVAAGARLLIVSLGQQQHTLRVRLSADVPLPELPPLAAARLRLFRAKAIRRGTLLSLRFPTQLPMTNPQ